jgi:hypothetical protein
MKMNVWTWIGIGGGIAGFLIGIISVLMTAGNQGIYVTLGMLAIFGGMAYLFYKLFFGPMLNASRLQKNGIPGKAIIVAVRDTGVTINNNPQVKLVLEVKSNLGQKYAAECRTLISRLQPGIFQPGMEVPVKIDPKNEKNVIVDFSGNSTTNNNSSLSQQDNTNLQTALQQEQKEQESIRLSGKPARAIIKKYTWLGVYINGNNPYAEIELEVLPDNYPSFSATTKGVIGEAAVEKFQPGKEIYVKYDQYDNSKVAMDHS